MDYIKFHHHYYFCHHVYLNCRCFPTTSHGPPVSWRFFEQEEECLLVGEEIKTEDSATVTEGAAEGVERQEEAGGQTPVWGCTDMWKKIRLVWSKAGSSSSICFSVGSAHSYFLSLQPQPQTCASYLCAVLQHLFNLGLRHKGQPLLWKMPCSGMSAQLPSHLMRWRCWRDWPWPAWEHHSTLQFAYQLHLGVDNAVICLMQRIHIWVVVSAPWEPHNQNFPVNSSIQPIPITVREASVDQCQCICYLLDYWLTDRQATVVWIGTFLSDMVVIDIGAPQGTVLSSFCLHYTPQTFSIIQVHAYLSLLCFKGFNLKSK